MKNEVLNLIGKSRLGEAIEFALEWSRKNDKDMENSLILLNGRWGDLKRSEKLGLLSYGDANIERAKIQVSLLYLLSNNTITVNQVNVINVSTVNFIINGIDCRDPQKFDDFLSKERLGVNSEFGEAIQFGKSVLEFMKDKFEERDFNMAFSPLKYAIEDLESRKSLQNLVLVISEIKKHKTLVLRFFKKEVKESLLEKLYNDAVDCNSREFCDKYEPFLKKYLEVNMQKAEAESVLSKWYYDRNEFFSEIVDVKEDDLYFISQLKSIRDKWLRKYKA